MIFPQHATECRVICDPFEAPGGISHVTVIRAASGIQAPLAVGPASKAPDMVFTGWSLCGVCAEVCVQTPLRPSLYLPLHDGAAFDEAKVEDALRQALGLWVSSAGLYVFCWGGRSRSPSFVAGLLALGDDRFAGFDEAMKHVVRTHPSTGTMFEPRGTIERVVARMLAAKTVPA